MDRTRTIGMLSGSWQETRDDNPDGSFTTYPRQEFASKSAGTLQTTTDRVIPGYRKRKAQGEVFMNPFSTTKTTRFTSSPNIVLGPDPNWGQRTFIGTMPCHWSVPPTRPEWFNRRIAEAQVRTVLMAHSKVANEDFLSLVTVAEAAKTAHMIRKPFEGAIDLINRIASRKLKLVKAGLTTAAAFSNAWAEYRFGWKPFLYEIDAIKESYYVSETANYKPERIVARASDRDIVWDLPNSVNDSPREYLSGLKMRSNYSHRAKVSSGVLYELQDENLTSASRRRMGLRLEDVASSIWELVPYSFVVDRFLDVGAWLSAIQPKPGVKILGSWTTTIDYQLNFHQVQEAYVNLTDPVVKRLTASGGYYSEEIQSVIRNVNPQLPPLPTRNYRDLNLVQQIDHAALITQRLLGLKHRS